MQSRKIRPKGGNDPAFGCRASADALVVPALWLRRVEHGQDRNQISSGYGIDLHRKHQQHYGELYEPVQDRKRREPN